MRESSGHGLGMGVSGGIPGDGNPGDGDPPCPGSESCCSSHSSPGCFDTTCCEVICRAQPACCTQSWTATCANLALAVCDLSACSESGCPGSISCCEPHTTRGCADEACCDLVCQTLPNCCEFRWSDTCVTAAIALCGSACTAGSPCPGTGDCCSSHESPGCDDPACCQLICERDPFCCSSGWDVPCAVQANDLCGGGEPYCPWCPTEGGCCELRSGPGCDREACCAAVCDIEPECCVVGWSSVCVELVDKVCFPTVCACDTLGDFGNDGAINLRDMAEFANCFTGLEGGPIDKPCACGDANGDASVDPLDYRILAPLLDP